MKKLLLSFCLIAMLTNVHAQVHEVLQETSWHVSDVEIDGVTYPSPLVNLVGVVDPNIDFDETLATAVLDPESDSFFSTISYDVTEQQFIFLKPAITLPGCQLYCDFAQIYFDFLFGDGENVAFTYTIVITDDGGYGLTIIDENGDEAHYQDRPILGAEDRSLSTIQLFPNPTTDLLFVDSEFDKVQHFVVYDTTGRQVLNITADDNSVNVSSLSAGVYFLEVAMINHKTIQKFIKR